MCIFAVYLVFCHYNIVQHQLEKSEMKPIKYKAVDIDTVAFPLSIIDKQKITSQFCIFVTCFACRLNIHYSFLYHAVYRVFHTNFRQYTLSNETVLRSDVILCVFFYLFIHLLFTSILLFLLEHLFLFAKQCNGHTTQ